MIIGVRAQKLKRGGHEFARLAPKAREHEKNNAISCVLVWDFVHGASDKRQENFMNIIETKPEQEDCPTLE